MLAEFVDRIGDQERRANLIQFQTHPHLPGKVFVGTDTGVQAHDVPPVPRAGFFHTIDDVVRCAQDLVMAPDPEVFVSNEAVVVVLNRQNRHERMTVPLYYTERWTRLAGLANTRESLTTAQAIRMLRFELPGTGTERVIQALRRIDFSRTGSGHATVEHGKETLGSAVEAAVQQADNIPETFVVTTPIWSNEGFIEQAEITCGVYLDLVAQKVEIGVLADELSRERNVAIESIKDRLEEKLNDAVPVFSGRP